MPSIYTGRAETLRLILAYSGEPFTDERITKKEFDMLKANFPFGQVQLLYENKKDALIVRLDI